MNGKQNKQNDLGKTNLIWRLDDEIPSHDIERKMLEERGYNLVVTRSATFREDYPRYAPLIKGILISPSFPLKAEDIGGLDSCKIITVTAGGFNNIDMDATTKEGIIVTYVPGYCLDEVSNHVLAMILSLNSKHRYRMS